MTKEEKIKEVLGDLYQYADNNGWIPFAFGITRSLKDSDLDKSRINEKLVIRPKSIQGIENNNGWIKIESENDLPNESSNYWVMQSDKRIQTIKEYFGNKEYYNITATHYQPIEKPKPPIY